MIIKRLLYLACTLVALFAAYRILVVDGGIVRTSTVVDGIPVEIFAPAPEPNARLPRVYPAVVIAHGYAGSKQVMYELARTPIYLSPDQGLFVAGLLSGPGQAIAVTFDFTGHGANTTPLSATARLDQLQKDIGRIVQYARSLPNVDPNSIALIGHSMGAGAVVQYANQHPDIKGVISISGGATEVTPNAPKNLLLLAGVLEFDSIKTAQKIALANAGGSSEAFWSGRARALEFVPSSEHLTVLWNDMTLVSAASWLRYCFLGGIPDRLRIIDRWGPSFWQTLPQSLLTVRAIQAALLLSLAVFVLFFPLSSFAVSRLGLRVAAPVPAGLPYGQVLLVALVPAVLAPLILRGLSLTPIDPATWLPIQIVNYMAMHFLLYAALMLGVLRLFGVRDLWARIRRNLRPAALVLAALFFAWIYVTNGVVAHLTWLNFLPSGSRLWLWPVVCALAMPYFVLNEYVTKAATMRRSALNELTSKVALIGSLLFAVAITPGLFFLLLVIAVFAVFFAVYGAYAVRLHSLTGNPLIAALGYAAMTAALLVAVFPITG
ncbi:MAG: alpha/beta fold hydrolase [Chloroflexi bacterium]|nr:alpha/beta fold hydrolase [Chloroflexota bacterium]